MGLLGALRIGADLAQPGDRQAPLDAIGMALFGAGLALALYGVGRGPVEGWTAAGAWLFWRLGLVLLAFYAGWASRHRHPAVDLSLLRQPQPALGLVLIAITSVVVFSALFVLPVYMQTIQRFTALQTGLAMLPQGLGMGLSTLLGSVVSRRGLVRGSSLAGMLLLLLATAGMTQLGLTTPAWVTALLLSVRGVGVGLVTQPLLETMMARVELERLPDANTLFSAVERLAGSFGIAVLATALQQREQLHIHTTAGRAIGEAMVQGFHDTVLLLAALALAGALASLLVRTTQGGESARALPPAGFHERRMSRCSHPLGRRSGHEGSVPPDATPLTCPSLHVGL